MTKSPLHVLIIDHEQASVRILLSVLARKDIRGTVAETSKEALGILEQHEVDLVFCRVDIQQPSEGLKMLHALKSNTPERPVIMMGQTDGPTVQNVQAILDLTVQCVSAGCRYFLMKPFSSGHIENLLDTLLPNQAVSMVNVDDFSDQPRYRIVGKSSKLIQTIELAKKVASTSMPVLVCGESGTGKELIASLIHHYSRRDGGPYMQVNCAALNEALLESELFGHEKGAFTGAYTMRKGRFERAHGGTLLLDEITETPLKFQATLLRVLEQQDFERVGGSDSVRVDVRIVSTTNKDLPEEVARGRFRQDLYYRLCGIRLVVPPLRERLEDLPELVRYFVNLYSRQIPRRITKLSPEMMDLFATYHWPGNIRQLRNVVRTSLALGTGSTLSLADVSWLFDELQPRPQKEIARCEDHAAGISNLSGLPLAEVERMAILDTLEQTAGNQTKAAKILGISDRTLRGKVRQYRRQECLQSA